MTERVVLAFSGGLDTSVAIPYLAEQTGAEVIAVAVDLGQGGEDMNVIRQRALDCGAVESEVVDAREEFAADFCLPALRANALYMDRYPLVSALSRPLIVKHLVAAAAKHGGTIVSHGCTGKGNDQVRFEVGIGALAPQLKVIAPARDYAWTRDKAIAYAEEKSLPIEVTHKSPYSIDQNLWGRAVETGFLENIWNAPIEDVYSYTQDPTVARDVDEVIITFDEGVPVAIDGETVTPYQAILQLNRRAGAHGVGRLDMVEDRLVGIKEPRGVRGARCDHAHHGAPGTGERDRGARSGPLQARCGSALGRVGVRRTVVLPAEAGAGRVHRVVAAFRHRRGAAGPTRRAGRGHRSAFGGLALRLRTGHLRRGRRVRSVLGPGLRRPVGPAEPAGLCAGRPAEASLGTRRAPC